MEEDFRDWNGWNSKTIVLIEYIEGKRCIS